MENDNLSTTIYLIPNCMSNSSLIPSSNNGFDWFLFFRGSCNDRDFLESGESKIERARNRRSRERKDIDTCSDFFDPVFMYNTKFMFFINNKESESLEFDIV